MGRRQSYQLTKTNPSMEFNLDWTPATLAIQNNSKFPVYVNIGAVNFPNAKNFNDVIPPFTGYVADPVGSQQFAVVVDNSSDLVNDFPFPVVVTFSTGAASVQSPLSLNFQGDVPLKHAVASGNVSATGLAFNLLALNSLISSAGNFALVGSELQVGEASGNYLAIAAAYFFAPPAALTKLTLTIEINDNLAQLHSTIINSSDAADKEIQASYVLPLTSGDKVAPYVRVETAGTFTVVGYLQLIKLS